MKLELYYGLVNNLSFNVRFCLNVFIFANFCSHTKNRRGERIHYYRGAKLKKEETRFLLKDE